MRIEVSTDVFRLAEAFTISRGSRLAAEVLTVRMRDERATGVGECVPYARYGESMQSVIDQITGFDGVWETLEEKLPPGAARNALDCAFWDHAAKAVGKPVWQIANLAPPRPVQTAFTLSLDTPQNMQDAAARHRHRPLLKIKLGTSEDMPRLEAVRRGAPDTAIIVDANEGWDADIYREFAPYMVEMGVKLVEQPLPAQCDDMLGEIDRPLPVCADESCHDRATLAALKGKYDMINIKLDKTGGLTEALALRGAARQEGYGVMVGCMVGTSLAMAPAILVAQGADVVDLDGPLLLAEDRRTAITYNEMGAHPASSNLWG